MLRRLYHDQPDAFAFTPANEAWAQAQMTKYPDGRQASAIIPLLWRAQEQEGWLSRPAIEHVAEMLGMAYIRGLEVATFYFMFQLQPVGSVAHIQICGTLSCMICGAEDLIGVCQKKIAANAHALSADGKFSWEEVECLGACANAPMAQIGKDYYEDLTADRLGEIIDELATGKVPVPGPQNGRYAAEPLNGLTSLKSHDSGRTKYNVSAQLATDLQDTIKRIDGTEMPLTTPWRDRSATDQDPAHKTNDDPPKEPKPGRNARADETGITKQQAQATSKGAVPSQPASVPAAATGLETETVEESEPHTMTAPRRAGRDDLKRISGIGPQLEGVLNSLGFWHFDQIAAWGPGEIAWVDSRIRFKGRIARHGWVAQARDLAKGS